MFGIMIHWPHMVWRVAGLPQRQYDKSSASKSTSTTPSAPKTHIELDVNLGTVPCFTIDSRGSPLSFISFS